MKYYIDQNYCANCIGCGTTCPTGAVVFNGVAKEIDQGKCIDCGRCLSYCNIGAIKTFEDEKRSAAIVKHNGYLEMDAALVVIGAGGGGMVAAARAAYLGVKNIVVLEKMYRYGGSAWFAHNLRAFNSKSSSPKGLKDPQKTLSVICSVRQTGSSIRNWFAIQFVSLVRFLTGFVRLAIMLKIALNLMSYHLRHQGGPADSALY